MNWAGWLVGVRHEIAEISRPAFTGQQGAQRAAMLITGETACGCWGRVEARKHERTRRTKRKRRSARKRGGATLAGTRVAGHAFACLVRSAHRRLPTAECPP